MTVLPLPKVPPDAPRSYADFIAEMRAFVESKNATWEIPLDATGMPMQGCDWDLRQLTESHARNACHLNGFAVDERMRKAVSEAAPGLASTPVGPILGECMQDFIKALVAHRCMLAHAPKGIQINASIYRKLCSATTKMPWEFNTDDFDRFISLTPGDDKVHAVIGRLANFMNERMLSVHCPISPSIPKSARIEAQMTLAARRGAERLPDADALFELTRIVFQEIPGSHQDLIRFVVLRLLILTGLRLNEVLMLPLDCLRWEEHLDVVTGAPGGEVGGCGRSLHLRYFAEKHMDGAPDILVEAGQWIPERFQSHVRKAVEDAINATRMLRATLAAQHANPDKIASSDLRKFKTTEGVVLNTGDLLFLVVWGKSDIPASPSHDTKIALVSESSMYRALRDDDERATLFARYGDPVRCRKMSLRPHSLRHLMNTELFRQNVPDTLITHQFGRQTVAQSYEYDHRSLAERLQFVKLPDAANGCIEKGTAQDLVARMVVSGVVEESHIARSFKKIQAEHGEAVAFQYLSANSDGFHVTPYGYCTNSFSVNPCSRHLKCFDNCKHFAASGQSVHRVLLGELREKLVSMRRAAEAQAPKTVGRANQIAHADRLIEGVQRALDARPGLPVFPGGDDHSVSKKGLFQ